METTNQKLFWQKLKDLGPQKRHDCFVNGIRNDEEDIITNKKEIRENVCNYFEMLYNREDYRHLNKDFYKEVLKQKTEWEDNMPSSMNIFNCDITRCSARLVIRYLDNLCIFLVGFTSHNEQNGSIDQLSSGFSSRNHEQAKMTYVHKLNEL